MLFTFCNHTYLTYKKYTHSRTHAYSKQYGSPTIKQEKTVITEFMALLSSTAHAVTTRETHLRNFNFILVLASK